LIFGAGFTLHMVGQANKTQALPRKLKVVKLVLVSVSKRNLYAGRGNARYGRRLWRVFGLAAYQYANVQYQAGKQQGKKHIFKGGAALTHRRPPAAAA
jgi:hypothetical protein